MAAEFISTATTHASRDKASAGPAASAPKRKMMAHDSQSLEATPVTPEVLMAEVRYGIVFGEMNELFYGRVNRALLFIVILAASFGGGSLLALLGKLEPDVVLPWTIAATLIGAAAEAARRAYKFGEAEKAYRDARAEFQELEGKGWAMNVNTLTKELAKLRKNSPVGMSTLAPMAYNKACRELGHPEVQMDIRGRARLVAVFVG